MAIVEEVIVMWIVIFAKFVSATRYKKPIHLIEGDLYLCQQISKIGGRCGIRTHDLPVMSRLL